MVSSLDARDDLERKIRKRLRGQVGEVLPNSLTAPINLSTVGRSMGEASDFTSTHSRGAPKPRGQARQGCRLRRPRPRDFGRSCNPGRIGWRPPVGSDRGL